MEFGTVKSYDTSRGFGFIEGDDDEDYFVHANDLDASIPGRILKPGQRVRFSVFREMKGDRAVKVQLLK